MRRGRWRAVLAQVRRALGGGLLVGMRAGDSAPGGSDGVFAPNAWVRVDRDGTVTVLIDRSEMGQGVVTALAMLVAEELEVDPAGICTEFAPAGRAYRNRLFDAQSTGGSTSVRAAWEPLRQAGAVARELLIRAAAAQWGVSARACRAARGQVEHLPSGRRLGYGALAAAAARRKPPRSVKLKAPAEFRLLGHPLPRLDIPDMVHGRTVYGIDVVVPARLVACVARCPVFGGRSAGFEADAALAVPGVRQVHAIPSGIAVLADTFWAAQRGRAALGLSWDEGPRRHLNNADIRARLQAALQRPGGVAARRGSVRAALERAAQRLEGVYHTPYLAHGPLEPMNCTARVGHDGCDIWVPTQNQQDTQETAMRLTGLPRARVRVHTTFLGGGFGRRAEQDFVEEAVRLAQLAGAPVQVIWTRDDDLQHDAYRPANCTLVRAGLDAAGRPLAWFQRIAGPALALDGVDIPYAVPHLRVETVENDPGVPTGAWRSVGASQNAFVVESFVDELACAAGQDPFEYRRGLLAHAPRHRAVLEEAAAQAGWGSPAPAGRHRGISLYRSYGSWVAQVAEISLQDARIVVHRVVCAIDCGLTVNPDTIRAQMEGGVAFGLSAALKEEVRIEAGRVVQSSFQDYPILTYAEMPDVEVHILSSAEPPGGVGEPGVPPIAPAVANAVCAATGRRLRSLPLQPALAMREQSG